MNERLQSALHQFRLSGLAQSLDVRLQEAAGHQLSHVIEQLWRKLCETTDGLEQNAMNSLHLNSPPKLGGVAEGRGGSFGNHPASLRSASPPNLGGEFLN